MRARKLPERPKKAVVNIEDYKTNPEDSAAKQSGEVAEPETGVSETDDIEALWEDDELGDPLTTTRIHQIPIGKPKDFFSDVQIVNIARRPGCMCTAPRTLLGSNISSSPKRCGPKYR